MLKSVQMYKDLRVMQDKAKAVIENKESKLEDINNIQSEITTFKAKIDMQLQIEEDERLDAENKAPAPAAPTGNKANTDAKAAYNKTFANMIRQKGSITAEDKGILGIKNQMKEGTSADGGAIVPVIDDTSIINLREADESAQTLIQVIPVTTLSGKKTIQKRHGTGTNFKKVGEGAPIGKGTTPQFFKIDWKVDKYASIYDITDEEFSDADAKVISLVNAWIGKDSRCLRNNLIFACLDTLPKLQVEGADDIKKVLNVKLSTVSKKYAVIATNQTGFNWLDTLKDGQGNYLLQKDVLNPTKRRIFNTEVKVYDDQTLPNVATKTPFIIGDLSNVLMFDRQNVQIKITDVGGEAYLNDEILMRAIEREQVRLLCDDVADLERDLVYAQIDIPAAE